MQVNSPLFTPERGFFRRDDLVVRCCACCYRGHVCWDGPDALFVWQACLPIVGYSWVHHVHCVHGTTQIVGFLFWRKHKIRKTCNFFLFFMIGRTCRSSTSAKIHFIYQHIKMAAETNSSKILTRSDIHAGVRKSICLGAEREKRKT